MITLYKRLFIWLLQMSRKNGPFLSGIGDPLLINLLLNLETDVVLFNLEATSLHKNIYRLSLR